MFLFIMVPKLKRFVGQWLIWFLCQRHLFLLDLDVLGCLGTVIPIQKLTDRADKDRPRIQVIDYLYKHPTISHTNLQDSSPIVISGV